MVSLSSKLTRSICLLATLVCYGHAHDYSAQLLYQFPSHPFTGIENVAVRPNGDLLFTTTSAPNLYLFNPSEANMLPQLLHTFSNATSCLGITQTSTDVFAVAVGSVNITALKGLPGTFSIWSVSFQDPSAPTFSEIAAIPQAKILNGLTHLQSNPAIVLAADSEEGVVYSLDVTSGAVAVAIQNMAFRPSKGPLGINGLHVGASGNTLYFTNSAMGTFGSIPINEMNGSADGDVTIIANDTKGNIFDDFALDCENNAWITNHPSSLTEVKRSGRQVTIYNSSQLLHPTSAIFSSDGHTLYVVTDGDAVNHSQSGQVWAVKI